MEELNALKSHKCIIFYHNLGSFDGYFIFKDSLRIFPVSLQELCSLFDVEGKTHPYNPLFNKLSLFENKILLSEFIKYSKQDSISLLKALLKAQKIYIDEHEVDIASI